MRCILNISSNVSGNRQDWTRKNKKEKQPVCHLMSKLPLGQRNDRGTKDTARGDGESQTEDGAARFRLLGDQDK